MSVIHYPSQTSVLPAPYTGSSIFEDQTPLPASSHAGLSQTAIIILISTIPIVLCFAIVFGIVRVVRRRNKRILQAKRQADIERRLRDRGEGRERIGGMGMPVPSRMVARYEGPPIPRAERGEGEVRDVE
ncbi:hypothetical protein SNOG_05824 [Parastagonospora nodorum SN15]|uniref:Uncharacterized protein n=1 Tax=Phaeosphaeria nodorum (strain SN15 / ATCC MYA-4574 / FGSC 10173) TaxID=321614 RepID=Q0UQZ0_PHANO|nr:hypothetical protein SNOG_05824 [Parastagonospora nodorum SN15]EAT86888.1 hypothetical protein SNOG_05824 [Parastagonospora nodorum SN15]